jgi:hypothetical protein
MEICLIIVSGETKKRLWARITILLDLISNTLVDRCLFTKLYRVTSDKTIILIAPPPRSVPQIVSIVGHFNTLIRQSWNTQVDRISTEYLSFASQMCYH